MPRSVGPTDSGRQVKFYALTRSGRAHLKKEIETWDRLSGRHQSRHPGDVGRFGLRNAVNDALVLHRADRPFARCLRDARSTISSMPISQFHLEEATAEYIREGLSPDEARRAALKAFGNPADVMEDVREVSMWIWWERLAQDLQLCGFAASGGPRRFTATAVLSLALGIGANTAIFSIFNTLVLRPLPVQDPATLFQVVHSGDGGSSESSTYALYDHLKGHVQTIAGHLPGRPDIDDAEPWSTARPRRSSDNKSRATTSACWESGRSSAA